MHCAQLHGICIDVSRLNKCMFQYYPWQTQQWHALLARWQAQRLPHALLCTGPKDLGKLDFAYAFVARLLCQTKLMTQEIACGTCQSCQWLTAGTHPDFFNVQPEAGSNIIKIEQIRELLESLQQTVQQALLQVVVIEPAEAVNNAAANALLKTLEEPPGPVIFFLVSHQSEALPPTIQSRCQKINFPVPPISISLPWLKNHLLLEQDLTLLLNLSENIPLRAIQFAQESRFKTHNQLVSNFIQLSQGNLTPLEVSSLCAEMDTKHVFEGLYLLLTDIIRLQQSPTSPITHSTSVDALTVLAAQVSTYAIFHFLDQLLEAKKHFDAKIHLNSLLLWEGLFADFWRIF